MSALTAMLFFGMLKEFIIGNETHLLYITIVVKVARLSYLRIDLGLNLYLLLQGSMVTTSKKIIRNIRQYNCLFAFTSMGAQIDNSVNDGRGPPLFKI
jgi:hypothetical protein